jgi:FkbM family methyltransferase
MQAASELETYRGYSEQDLDLFGRYAAPEAQAEPGFVTMFLGSKVRTSILPEEIHSLDGQKLAIPVPCDFLSDAIEWIGLLRSVSEANRTFRMMEVGAGFGPWSAAGVVAARRRGIKDIHATAVEADPVRFAALRQTVDDNDFASIATLHCAAVDTASGVGHWPNAPQSLTDAGLRLIPEGERTDYRGRVYADTREVTLIAFSELIGTNTWDLIHVDVQGHELNICTAAMEALNRHVRRLIIGTHSRKLDGDVFDLFWRAGWTLENEKPSRVDFRKEFPSLEHMTTHDGTQIWRNTRV